MVVLVHASVKDNCAWQNGAGLEFQTMDATFLQGRPIASETQPFRSVWGTRSHLSWSAGLGILWNT